jgi:tetratricopeptide (TPR) repeat protein
MPMRCGSRQVFLAVATSIPLGIGIFFLLDGLLRPRPTLDEVCALAQANRFDEAQARGTYYLRLFPADSRAYLVMAEIALARPSPEPRRALEWLDRIRPDSPSLAAWVLLDQGNAYYLLSRYGRSEACWKEALRQDPSVLPAGRRLLDLFRLQGRFTEASSLALPQLKREPDPRDRLLLLLKLVQLEVDPPEPWSIVNQFEPVVRGNPVDLPTSVACGLALVSVSRSGDGLSILRQALDCNPDDPTAWDALLTGLGLANRSQEFADVFSRLPHTLAALPRFAKHQGRLHQEAGRWSDAARAYRRAWDYEPDNIVGYRLRRALSFAGQTEEAARWDRLVLDYRSAFKQARGIAEQLSAALNEGRLPGPGLCQLMAGARARMGRVDEARAWQQLELQNRPAPKGVRMSP